jgi:hypothetical protein
MPGPTPDAAELFGRRMPRRVTWAGLVTGTGNGSCGGYTVGVHGIKAWLSRYGPVRCPRRLSGRVLVRAARRVGPHPQKALRPWGPCHGPQHVAIRGCSPEDSPRPSGLRQAISTPVPPCSIRWWISSLWPQEGRTPSHSTTRHAHRPELRADLYRARAPIRHADRIKDPLLPVRGRPAVVFPPPQTEATAIADRACRPAP